MLAKLAIVIVAVVVIATSLVAVFVVVVVITISDKPWGGRPPYEFKSSFGIITEGSDWETPLRIQNQF